MTPKNTDTNLPPSLTRKYVKLGYHYLISYVFVVAAIPLLITAFISVQDIVKVCLEVFEYNSIVLFSCMATFVLLGMVYFISRPRKVYMLDFTCCKPDWASKVPLELFMEMTTKVGTFSDENLTFQKRMLERSGLGQETYLPLSFLHLPPMIAPVKETINEAKMFMATAIDELLAKTNVKAKDIGVLIVNSSLFHTTPSLCTILINHYKFRDDVSSFNLSAMGCSASVIAIDLASHLLQVHANTYALVVSLEQGTQSNWYLGNDRSMLVGNCIFRSGVAAMLLSNHRSSRNRSKYQLIHTVRTNKAAEDKCYSSVFQKEDPDNFTGISLSKDLMSVAGKALNTNITTLGPLVLPLSEKLLFFVTLVARKAFKVKQYVPDFKLAFEHFCIHPGGKAVLDAVQKSDLQLSEWHMEPSKMTLYRFGNTSSTGLWYALAYMEVKGRIKKGDRIWQIAFGSGFKCNSVVWRALKTVNPAKDMNPWIHEIHNLPTHT